GCAAAGRRARRPRAGAARPAAPTRRRRWPTPLLKPRPPLCRPKPQGARVRVSLRPEELMPSPLTIATDLVRRWTWLYTCGLDADVRDARRAEIESDLWDFRDDVKTSGANEPSARAHVLARLALGIADDLLWRREHAILMTPATLASTGVLRTPIVVRRVSGFGVSAVCHLALLTAAVWL